MASPGLSLVGFLDEKEALQHMKTVCVPINLDDNVLKAEWKKAQAALGSGYENAGSPLIEDLSQVGLDHVDMLLQQEWVKQRLPEIGAAWTFKSIEIDPLLAFQAHINIDRSKHHCSRIGTNSDEQELLSICLPQQAPQEQMQMHANPQSILIAAPNLNVRPLAQGYIPPFFGILVGVALPFVHVVEFEGRYYLHNGYHRSLGLREAGIMKMPCLLRSVASFEEVGLHVGTLPQSLFATNNAPTVGHFTQGRAHQVAIRAVSRTMHVSWAEYVVPLE
jgi:hypothetical protein